MAVLSRKQIDAADDIKTETVPVPEWGGEVLLRSLSSKKRSEIEATLIASKNQKPDFRVEALKTLKERTVAAAMVDQAGNRLYSDKEIGLLGERSGDVIERLFNKVQELSGMDKDAVKRAEGNSAPAPNDSSGSA